MKLNRDVSFLHIQTFSKSVRFMHKSTLMQYYKYYLYSLSLQALKYVGYLLNNLHTLKLANLNTFYNMLYILKHAITRLQNKVSKHASTSSSKADTCPLSSLITLIDFRFFQKYPWSAMIRHKRRLKLINLI